MTKIVLLSGPNLNLLGTREPEIYGTTTLEDLTTMAREAAQEAGFEIEHLQTNSEAEMVEAVHSSRSAAGVIINPGAFTHYSWALADALSALEIPIVELHISNPESREPWRRTSVVAPVATGTISGFGQEGYRLAVLALVGICASRSDGRNS